MLLCTLPGLAPADMIVQWRDSFGFWLEESVTPLLPDIGDESRARLVFSTDPVADPINNPQGIPSNGDLVLDQITLRNLNGTPIEQFGLFVNGYNRPFEPGYIYVQVFEGTTFEPGTRYYQGPVVAAIDNPGPPTLADIYETGMTPGGDELDRICACPEPGTASLAVAGGIFLSLSFGCLKRAQGKERSVTH